MTVNLDHENPRVRELEIERSSVLRTIYERLKREHPHWTGKDLWRAANERYYATGGI